MKISKRHFEATTRLAFTVALTGLVAISGAIALPKVPPSSATSSPTASDATAVADTKQDAGAVASKDGATASDTTASDAAESKSSQTASEDTDKTSEPKLDATHDTVIVDGTKMRRADAEAAILSNQAADHFDLAQHYSHKWDWEMSEVELEAAIMCVPTLKAAHRDYCVVSLFRGQPMRSLAEFMMVVGLGDPIPLNEEEKTALKKKAAKLHYQKGLNYGIVRKWKKATPEFQWALSYAPDSAAIAHSLAFSYAADGDFENAEKLYLKAVALDPTNSYSHADFAILLSEHGDQQKAMQELAKAISLSPDVAALHVDMAWLAESSGDLKTAESEFHHAVQLSPKHAGLWSHLGRVEERLGKASDAKTAYSEALAVDPGDDVAKARLDALGKSSSAKPAADSSESGEINPTESKKQS